MKSQVNKLPFFKQALFAFFIAVLLLTLTLTVAAQKIKSDMHHFLTEEIRQYHTISNLRLEEFSSEEERFISMISGDPLTLSFARNYQTDKKRLITKFLAFTNAKTNIMQLRFLDLQGNELIRVDRDRKGLVHIIKKNKLQNKLNRYYFKQFCSLAKGKIGYSHFDLNIEHKQVELPFNPTTRIGKGVYVGGKLRGIIVVNYYMNDWLKYFTRFSTAKVTIIDKDGYFLYHYDPDWEWSKYLTPQKKAQEFYHVQIPDFKNGTTPYELAPDVIGYTINLFGNTVMIVYEPNISIENLVLEKSFTFSLIVLIVIFLTSVPFSYLVFKYIKELHNANYTIEKNSVFINGIFNNTFEALVVTDKFGSIEKVNYAALQLFGYDENELLGKNVKIFVPEPHHSRHDEYMRNAQSVGRVVLDKQRRLFGLNKEGMQVPLSLAVTKMEIGNEIYFIASIQDLTEVKELEDATKKQESIIFNQSKMAAMGEMIGAIAHQWRQPLNELTIRIQKLKYNYQKEQIDEKFITAFIEKNKKTIEFMSQTIDDFRNFFRIDKEKKPFQIKEAIEEILNIQNAQLRDHNIEVHLRGKEFTYEGFKTEFQQVILNIISNAKDALIQTKVEKPNIEISIEGKQVLISDNAGGIPQDIIERIFEPYFTTKEQGEGTGMGLYMSKMIIEENMHGKIFAKNYNDGVQFIIDFANGYKNA